MMFEVTNLSDNSSSSEEEEDEVKPQPPPPRSRSVSKVETIHCSNAFPSQHIFFTNNNIRNDGASCSGSNNNNRSSLLGMGFPPDHVDKAIQQHGEDNMDLLLEALVAYSTLQTSKVRSLQPAQNGSLLDKDKDLAQASGKRKALLISHSESSDSLDDLFEDEKDISSRGIIGSTTIPLKEDSNECCDDKKASLLMMNFTMEEVEFAINKLGKDAPVNELVDFIFAAQMAATDDSNMNHGTRNEDANTETLFGTMDKTLRLLEIGFSEQEISAAIEKYGEHKQKISFV